MEGTNFVPSAGKGCHIAHYSSDWIVSYTAYDKGELGVENDEDVPEISVDLDDGLLTAINTSDNPKTFYLSLQNACINEDDEELEMGETLNDAGKREPCITFILTVGPKHMMDVCYIELPDENYPDIYSHVTELKQHPSPGVCEGSIGFPLKGKGPFLCTQGCNGCLTHFKPETYHAVDWRCPVGTPVVAVGDGEVVEVSDKESVSGIHTKNLFVWNSIMLKLSSGVFVEYVHIKQNSAKVKVGDKVKKGQVICESGNVGFCPEPHLHLQLQTTNDNKAATAKFAVKDSKGANYYPEAGHWYNSDGECTVAK